MSAPQKPWENCNPSNNLPAWTPVTSLRMNSLHSHAPQPSTHVTSMPLTGSARGSALPPLPPRPPQLTSSMSGRSMYTTTSPMYGGYSGYSGYGGYSSFGGYPGMYGAGGYGYGSFGFPANGYDNRFLQVAEESSRDAFQSIESLVRAFTSVSMMLESTYLAMYSSFRAVLGVVDNFSRMRQMFAQFLSAITVFRIIKNFYRRLLYWLGVLEHSPQPERVWDSVTGQERVDQVAGFPKWPLITFIAFLFGGPYLISKFFSSCTLDGRQWDPQKGKTVRTAFPHKAGTQEELSFEANELLNIAPRELQPCENSGWLLAANQNGRVGYVPVTRLSTSRTAQHNVASSVDPSVAAQSSAPESTESPETS